MCFMKIPLINDVMLTFFFTIKESLKLTAKVGTMKRKRQLRDILDHHDKDHEDDAFDSTPFKRTKTIKVGG